MRLLTSIVLWKSTLCAVGIWLGVQNLEGCPKIVKNYEVCRSPDEMRMKLSVQFQGEEGIDAGGVSREWYQVTVMHPWLPAFLLSWLARQALCILLISASFLQFDFNSAANVTAWAAAIMARKSQGSDF